MATKQKTLYDRVNDYLKKYQSGFDTVDDYNGKFYQVQYELANYLIHIYARNERAQQYLQPLIVSADVTGSASGVMATPADFMQFLSAEYAGKPVHKVSVNQLVAYEELPQRRGDLTKKRVNITGINNGWLAKPASAYTITVNYVKHPPVSTIAFTLTETADEDILTYDEANTEDFVWSEDCINLLVYMMLEKVGIAVREEILREYAQLGLNQEAGK